MNRLPFLPARSLLPFPSTERALRDPDGLLCAGGDLSAERLLLAYRSGIFPWFSAGDPILWWSPDPRAVFLIGDLVPNRRLARSYRAQQFEARINDDFAAVMSACAAPRAEQSGTWITPEMHAAYRELHRLGHAHAISIFQGPIRVGGLYGLAIGRVFFGESMFSRVDNASKFALHALARLLAEAGFVWLDGQVQSDHLERLGVRLMARRDFVAGLADLCQQAPTKPDWFRPESGFGWDQVDLKSRPA